MRDTLARPMGFLSILLGVASIALFAVSVWGFRASGWPWPQAYDLAGWGAWAAGAGVVVALTGLVVWLRRGTGGVSTVLLGLILSLPVAGLGAAFEIAARTTPPINDISTDTEDPPVFWFTATSTLLSLLTLPFGWVLPSPGSAALLVLAGFLGGTAQIFLTSSYRFADASVVAPFDYASMLFALLIGYFVFAEVPTAPMLGGAALIIVAGIAIVLREGQLGLRRTRAGAAKTPNV